MSITDLLIGLGSIIFVMSTISERVSNFLKLYFQDKVIYIPVIPHKENGKWMYLMEAKLRILAQQQATEAAEKEREYRILVINIIVGVLSAAFININIFELFDYIKSSGKLNIGWNINRGLTVPVITGAAYLSLFLWSTSLILFSKLQEKNKDVRQRYVYIPLLFWLIATLVMVILLIPGKTGDFRIYSGKILFHFAGYLIMGLFLSLGSKFWHDLLDILFSFKRTQEKVTDPKLLTDFNSADQIIKYTDISQYDIAEQLYEKYKSRIWDIAGIVSCGLITYFDERVRLYQKRIEVEFTTIEAQNQLLKIQSEGEVQISYNTFLLKEYFEMKFTKGLIALPDTGIGSQPVCYTRNMAATNENIKGSFNVKKTIDGRYIAFGCLHVFASANDFSRFRNNEKAPVSDVDVLFSINGIHSNGKIIPESILFGNQRGNYGADYCECSIDEDTYNQYNEFIRQFNLEKIEDHQMNLFGATSKAMSLNESEYGVVECNVDYNNGFYKTLQLFKINASTRDKNVNPGDSGATVYYKSDDSSVLCLGMIIAKTDSCAYMCKLNKISITDSCKLLK